MTTASVKTLNGITKKFFLRREAETARHVVAYLTNKDRENMPLLRMMKLIYLAEKKHLKLSGNFLIYDNLESWKLGPVCSHTYKLIKDSTDKKGLIWYADVKPYGLIHTNWDGKDPEDLEELSISAIMAMDEAWEELKDKNHDELKEYAHDPKINPEWQELEGRKHPPIDLDVMLKGMGITRKGEIEQIKENLSLDYPIQ